MAVRIYPLLGYAYSAGYYWPAPVAQGPEAAPLKGTSVSVRVRPGAPDVRLSRILDRRPRRPCRAWERSRGPDPERKEAARIIDDLEMRRRRQLRHRNSGWIDPPAGVTRDRRQAFLAADGRPNARNRHANYNPSIPYHSGTVVTPVRMFTGYQPVVIDQEIHGVRKRDYLRGSLGLDPAPEKALGKCADRCVRVAAEIPGLERGLPRADQDAPLRVHGTQHG